jgi:DNA-binding response OmpR family regulator
MNTYENSRKTLEKIRQEFNCKGDIIFRTAMQYVVEYGQITFEDIEWVKSQFDRIDAKHDTADGELIKFDNLEISLQKYELKVRGKVVDLPPKELELIYFLASNYNRVFTRDQLLDKVWGFDYLGDSRTVDVHIKRLREKLEGASDKWSLKTVWGIGYKFEVRTES